MKLTEHFSDAELGVDFADAEKQANAASLCSELLEPIRAHYASPVRVHCGYRAPEHNAEVGGKANSFHLFAGGHAAADFHVEDVGLAQCFDWIRGASGLPFDKVILEHTADGVPRTIHIQIDRHLAPRRQAYIGSTGDGKQYTAVAVGPSGLLITDQDIHRMKSDDPEAERYASYRAMCERLGVAPAAIEVWRKEAERNLNTYPIGWSGAQ